MVAAAPIPNSGTDFDRLDNDQFGTSGLSSLDTCGCNEICTLGNRDIAPCSIRSLGILIATLANKCPIADANIHSDYIAAPPRTPTLLAFMPKER